MGKLLPFAQQCTCKEEQPDTVVQEDKAQSPPPHYTQQEIFSMFDISPLLWPGNLPDLNVVKLAWSYLKQMAT